jgi:hypothetical protein
MQHDQLGEKLCHIKSTTFLFKELLDMMYSQGHEYKGKIDRERENFKQIKDSALLYLFFILKNLLMKELSLTIKKMLYLQLIIGFFVLDPHLSLSLWIHQQRI